METDRAFRPHIALTPKKPRAHTREGVIDFAIGNPASEMTREPWNSGYTRRSKSPERAIDRFNPLGSPEWPRMIRTGDSYILSCYEIAENYRVNRRTRAQCLLNACSDGSADLVQSFAARLPVATALTPRIGLSRARSCAIESCHGEFIVFIDDGVRVGPLFLRAYETAFGKWPEADLFAGPGVPFFEGDIPTWLRT